MLSRKGRSKENRMMVHNLSMQVGDVVIVNVCIMLDSWTWRNRVVVRDLLISGS